MENYITIMKEKVAAADMVLVGIGEDFGCKEKKIFESDAYHEIFSGVIEEKEWVYITPSGNAYHKNPNCSYLNPQIYSAVTAKSEAV